MSSARTIGILSLKAVFGLVFSGYLGAQNLPDSIVTYYYPSKADSVNWIKISNEFNGAGGRTSYTYYLWNTDLHRWDGWEFPCEECAVSTGRFEYSYDDRGNPVSRTAFGWVGPPVRWAIRSLSGYVFDDSGNNISSTNSIWNAAQGKLLNNLRFEYTYDEERRMLSSVADRWIEMMEVWHPIEKWQYAFESGGRKSQEIRQTWVDSIRDWVNRNKTEWYFDTAGIKTEIAGFGWVRAGEGSTWIEQNRHKVENVFDSAGNRILTTDFLKVSATRWTATFQEERKYSSTGQPLLSVIRKGNGALTESLRTEWAYDPEGGMTLETQSGVMPRRTGSISDDLKVIRSFGDKGVIDHEIWYHMDHTAKSYVLASKDYYFYPPASGGQPETVAEAVRLFPNPSGGMLHLSGLPGPALVKIHSLQGVHLRSVPYDGNPVNISDLPPGAYMIQVCAKDHSLLKTLFIKQ